MAEPVLIAGTGSGGGFRIAVKMVLSDDDAVAVVGGDSEAERVNATDTKSLSMRSSS
jgi:NAD(P)-dependent dehydrogenase (short-subunit alcohol dehydrogenase family)